MNKEDRTKEEQINFLMSKEPKGNVWYADPQNVNLIVCHQYTTHVETVVLITRKKD